MLGIWLLTCGAATAQDIPPSVTEPYTRFLEAIEAGDVETASRARGVQAIAALRQGNIRVGGERAQEAFEAWTQTEREYTLLHGRSGTV
ncbi:MAG: hypothetical protein AAFX09_00405 [Pseudomonadota bacterium]